MAQSIRIRLKAFDHEIIDQSTRKIVETVTRTNATVRGPIPLPTDKHRYTVIRGPHIDKDSREHFEMRVHKRLIDIVDPNAKTIDSLQRIELPAGVDIEIKIQSQLSIDLDPPGGISDDPARLRPGGVVRVRTGCSVASCDAPSTRTELIGYLASALVVVSLAMTSVVRLRAISLVGSIAFVVVRRAHRVGADRRHQRRDRRAQRLVPAQRARWPARRSGAVVVPVDSPFLVDFLQLPPGRHPPVPARLRAPRRPTRHGGHAADARRPAGRRAHRPTRAGTDLYVLLDHVTKPYRDSQISTLAVRQGLGRVPPARHRAIWSPARHRGAPQLPGAHGLPSASATATTLDPPLIAGRRRCTIVLDVRLNVARCDTDRRSAMTRGVDIADLRSTRSHRRSVQPTGPSAATAASVASVDEPKRRSVAVARLVVASWHGPPA